MASCHDYAMTPKDFTDKLLTGWGGGDIFNQALVLAHRGQVKRADWHAESSTATGEITLPNGWDMKTGFELRPDGLIRSHCPCRTNQEFGMVCPHVIAIALVLMCRMNDPEAEEKYQAEQRTARRIAAIDPAAYIQRDPSGTPMRLSFTWSRNFFNEFQAGCVHARLTFIDGAGRRHRPEDLCGDSPIAISPGAENLLSVIEDICEGPARENIALVPADFLNVLAVMSPEKPVRCVLRAEYFEDSGKFELFPFAELPFEHVASADRFLVHGSTGFVWSQPIEAKDGPARFFPLANVLKQPFQSLYLHDEIIERSAMYDFLHTNLPLLRRQIDVQLSPSEDLFQFVPGSPAMYLKVSGTRASLGADLFARYGDQEVKCGSGGQRICQPDPDDLLRYNVRNIEAERAAFAAMKAVGFEQDENSGRWFITEPGNVLNFFGSGEPRLRRLGWKVRYAERLAALVESMPSIVPVVKVSDAPRGAFDVSYAFETNGARVPDADIQAAINRGDSYILDGARTILLDTSAISAMREVFADCPIIGDAPPGHFRVGHMYAPYVKGAMDALGDVVELEDVAAPSWRETAAQRNRDEGAKYEPVDLGQLEHTLRPYQKDGVYWMRFLEKSGLSGLLADEMGLGKTLQTLTWLSLERTDPEARGKPALVICPTSLVANWNAEAEKFVPWMKRLVISGPNRSDAFGKIPEADIVITSYALLQRDLEDAYAGRKFSVVVLDEAQHIKNRSTRNAKSAKRLDSVQKLVLTGTPVENSVADVWSIFDFLLPDYLGRYDAFNATVQQPIEAGGPDGAAAQERLHHKLKPFILRRLKKLVAKDLPDKIVKVAYCPMSEEQQRWYNKLLQDARTRIGDMVKKRGFARSKIEILALLMRLRQVASHLELLKEYREKNPRNNGATTANHSLSGKLDVFFELLDEAIDGGHRVLVFSQFVSMLSILRSELEARGIAYCYLDGSTKDRLGECRKFNTDESIPLFLISLHAGGTGLNLTGADMVIHFDPWWNPAVEDQATDRAHRIGQKRTVYVVKMIAEGSVEERVLALQQKKQLVIDATVGTTDAQAMQKLSYDDVKAIVGL